MASRSTAESTSVISARGLTKRFGDRTAVDGLDLDVPRGVVAGFVGPNGSGKTTTMAMLLGLVRPTSGTAHVLGSPIAHASVFCRRVGALIETPAFYPHLTGEQNLRALAIVGRHRGANIPALLRLVGLSERGGDRYRTYSLGMKQRLGIAAALIGDPELLVLDEPSNGLDPQGMREMRELIERIARADRTVLVSSHMLSELEQICDWLVLIDTGRSVYQGPAADFLADGAALAVAPQRSDDLDGLLRVVIGTGLNAQRNAERVIIPLRGRDRSDLAAQVNAAAFAAGLVLVEIAPVRDTLEERYLSLVGAPANAASTNGASS
jgi:ABC-2 type transport system ATP-binding protein